MRRSLGQHIGVDAVLVDRDDTPAGFAVDLVDDRLLDLPEKVGRELRVRRDEIRFVRDRYSRNGSQLRRYLVVVVTAQAGHQIVALDGRRGFGDRLTRQRRIEPTENTCETVRGTDDVVALGAIELHSVDDSRHQDIRARMLVDPRSRRRGCPQRHRLLVTEARMNVRRTPPDGPVAVLASHLQLAVVRPHTVFRKVPLVGVADRRSVTVHLHRRGLGSHRLGLERIPGVTQYRTRGIRPVRQFCCLVDIPVTERTQELLRDGLGAGGFRSTRTDPHRQENHGAGGQQLGRATTREMPSVHRAP